MDLNQITVDDNTIKSVLEFGSKHLEHLKFRTGFDNDQFRQSLHKILSMT